MKTNILYTGVCLATLLLAGVSCSDDKIDNSAFDEELGKDFNQKVIWDGILLMLPPNMPRNLR